MELFFSEFGKLFSVFSWWTVAFIVGVTLVMIPINMWMVSKFMGIDIQGFINGFLAVCVGFNLIKATANLTIYSLISPILSKEFNKLFNK